MFFDLMLRELLMLVTMGAAGSGFVATLCDEDRPGSRLALSVGAGLVILPGLLVLIDFFVPLRFAFWYACLPVCALSIWRAHRRLPWSRSRPGRRELTAVALVLVASLSVGNFILLNRSTFGPMGYGIFDAVGYVTCVEGYTADRDNVPVLGVVNEAAPGYVHYLETHGWGRPWNVAAEYCWGSKQQHTASTTIPAVASGAFGWPAWTLIAPFMVVLLCAGALGTFALGRGLGGLGRWSSALAGLLFLGPTTYQIYTDGSLGLLAGIGTLPLIVITVASFVRAPSRRIAVLLGACGGALSAVYPEQLASVTLGSGFAAIVSTGLWLKRNNRPTRTDLRRVVGLLALLFGAALLISPRSIPWTWGYLGSQAVVDTKGLIHYPNMTLHYVLGWLAQTRAFYDFVFAAPVGTIEVFTGLVIPICLVGVICIGVVRSPRVRILLGFLAAASIQAAVSGFKYDCSYCVQRSLLLTTPLLPVLIVAGFSALAALRWRWGRDTATAVLGAYLVVVAATMYSAVHRTTEGSTVWPASMQSMASAISQKTSGGLALEGFDADPYSSWVIGPAAFETAVGASSQRVGWVATNDEYGGLAYLGVRPFGDASWNPNYKWVWTRLGGVSQGRTTAYRMGPYALQRRAYPFDVIIAGGVAAEPAAQDPIGQGWVQSPGSQLGLTQGPLTFWIAATSKKTAYLRVQLIGPPNLAVAPRAGLVQRHPSSGVLDVCEPIAGTKATRVVSYDVSPPSGPLLGSGDPLNPAALPATTIRLSSALATSTPC